MASLQARHSKGCALGKASTKADKATLEGCSCDPGPVFYIVVNLGPGGRRSVGRNRRTAERELAKVQVAQSSPEGWEPESNLTFNEWADEWFRGLRKPGENTKRSYVATLDYAREAFGEKRLARLTVDDIEEFLSLMTRTVRRDGEMVVVPISGSTQAKHLRVISACFKDAVRRRKMTRNPVAELGDSHRPQTTKDEAAYFTDDEIPRLLAALSEHDRPLVKFALATGMRVGELTALKWRNVDLLNRVVHVREAWKDGLGVGEPKSKKSRRSIRLANGALATLEELARQGVVRDDDLVFPTLVGDYRHTYDIARRVLYPAMEKAGIPRVGPTGTKRTFHSLRHTYARITLEAGGDIAALSKRMGHSTVAVTQDVYGHWSEKAEAAEIAKLDAALEAKGLLL